ncbi:hypothetical protein E6H33_01415 [Candidatus Bathyarchaeota archaeon]|nr:MAG: hypothetical protein E6H33_01415 [Candidatus Bathyarchaeota archaeon]
MAELWKLNNLFKLFLLSFIAVFLFLIFVLDNIPASRYMLIVLAAGTITYLIFSFRASPTASGPPITPEGRLHLTRTHLLAIVLIFSLFVSSYIIVRTVTAPSAFQLVKFQYLVLPNGTVLSMSPLQPSNECAWLESMNITTQERAKQQGLPDCDFVSWYHRTSPPTLFLEFQNFTEFAYNLNGTAVRTTGSELLCFFLSSESFQCWVPPATVSHLK